MSREPTVAIIGAGLAGLAAARKLQCQGVSVTVFDKARGAGGRTAVRRSPPWEFDHGAQYFTVRDARFRAWVDEWIERGLVAAWNPRLVRIARETHAAAKPERRFVGTPGMNAMAKDLAAGLNVRVETRIKELTREGRAWLLHDSTGAVAARAEVVVVSAPAEQTVGLLPPGTPLTSRATSVTMRPCWAVMLGFDRPLRMAFDAAFIEDGPLSWVARNNSKPGRPDAESWVLHAAPGWSADHIEDDPQAVAKRLTATFFQVFGIPRVAPDHADAHRWRRALPEPPLVNGSGFDTATGIAICGDWCQGARVEGAFLSGLGVADEILAARE